jgi:hypothetical protein
MLVHTYTCLFVHHLSIALTIDLSVCVSCCLQVIQFCLSVHAAPGGGIVADSIEGQSNRTSICLFGADDSLEAVKEHLQVNTQQILSVC